MKYDLHPDDLVARIELRASLRAIRTAQGLSGQEVSRRAGLANVGSLMALERTTSWEVWRVQAWARGLARVFRMRITGLAVPPDDVTSAVLKSTTAFGSRDEDDLHLRIVAADLIRTRRALMSRAEQARRCGVTERPIGDWEQFPQLSLLRLYQRYARAMGGRIDLELQDVPVGVRA